MIVSERILRGAADVHGVPHDYALRDLPADTRCKVAIYTDGIVFWHHERCGLKHDARTVAVARGVPYSAFLRVWERITEQGAGARREHLVCAATTCLIKRID